MPAHVDSAAFDLAMANSGRGQHMRRRGPVRAMDPIMLSLCVVIMCCQIVIVGCHCLLSLCVVMLTKYIFEAMDPSIICAKVKEVLQDFNATEAFAVFFMIVIAMLG